MHSYLSPLPKLTQKGSIREPLLGLQPPVEQSYSQSLEHPFNNNAVDQNVLHLKLTSSEEWSGASSSSSAWSHVWFGPVCQTRLFLSARANSLMRSLCLVSVCASVYCVCIVCVVFRNVEQPPNHDLFSFTLLTWLDSKVELLRRSAKCALILERFDYLTAFITNPLRKIKYSSQPSLWKFLFGEEKWMDQLTEQKKAHINLDQLHDGGNSSFDSSAATSSSMQVWYKYLCAYLQHRPMRHINNDYATQYVQMWSWAVITVCSIVYWNVQCMSSINHLSKRFTIEPKTDQRCSGNHTSIIKRTQAEYYMMLLCIQFIPLHEQCCMKHQTRYTYKS